MKYKEMGISEMVKMGVLKAFRMAYSGGVKKHAKHKPKPLMVMRYGKPYVTIERHSDDHEKLLLLKTGKITWEDFKETMLQKGYEDMVTGKTRVKPGDIVGAERVEVERTKAKIDTAEFMLKAAKYFSGELYICGKCGHKMIPASVKEENEYLDEPKDTT